jgi:hypothetical protein
MAKESRFNAEFRRQMEKLGMRIYRVESHATCPGMPDNHYIVRDLPGASGWMEIKEDDTMRNAIAYRPQQVPWLLDYSKQGGRCWTVVHVPSRRLVLVVPGKESLVASKDIDRSSHFRVSLDWDDPYGDLLAIFCMGKLSKACRVGSRS